MLNSKKMPWSGFPDQGIQLIHQEASMEIYE